MILFSQEGKFKGPQLIIPKHILHARFYNELQTNNNEDKKAFSSHVKRVAGLPESNRNDSRTGNNKKRIALQSSTFLHPRPRTPAKTYMQRGISKICTPAFSQIGTNKTNKKTKIQLFGND